MSRYIDANALIKSIESDRNCSDMPSQWIDGVNYAIDLIELYEPTIDAVSEWIPCEERLPSENEEALVCDKDGTMEVCDLETFGRGVGLKWTDKNGYECWLDVVAWMPLPKPYGEREGE